MSHRAPAWIERLESQLSDLQDLGTDVFVGHPATEEAIATFELAMGVALPTSYRELVATYGWLELGAVKILGLERAEVQTHAARAQYELGAHCIVASIRATDGALLCLDTTGLGTPVLDSAWSDSARVERESPLVLFEPDLGRASPQTATFAEWLSALVTESLRRARQEN